MPYEVNGRRVRVALGGDYNQGTLDEVSLLINIDAASEAEIVKYSELGVQVWDTEGKVVEVVLNPEKMALKFERGQLCAAFDLKIHKGRKIESVKIRWGDSERMFLYSKKEIRNVYYF